GAPRRCQAALSEPAGMVMWLSLSRSHAPAWGSRRAGTLRRLERGAGWACPRTRSVQDDCSHAGAWEQENRANGLLEIFADLLELSPYGAFPRPTASDPFPDSKNANRSAISGSVSWFKRPSAMMLCLLSATSSSSDLGSFSVVASESKSTMLSPSS